MCQDKELFMTWITAIFAFKNCLFEKLKLLKLDLEYEKTHKNNNNKKTRLITKNL